MSRAKQGSQCLRPEQKPLGLPGREPAPCSARSRSPSARPARSQPPARTGTPPMDVTFYEDCSREREIQVRLLTGKEDAETVSIFRY